MTRDLKLHKFHSRNFTTNQCLLRPRTHHHSPRKKDIYTHTTRNKPPPSSLCIEFFFEERMVFSGIIFDDTKRKKSWEKMNKISRTKKALHQHMLPLLFQDKASVRRNHVAVVFLLLVGVCVLLSTTKLAALNNNGMSEDLN